MFRLQNVSRCDVVYIQNQRPRRSATEAVLRSDLCFYSTNILYTQISSFAGEFMMSVSCITSTSLCHVFKFRLHPRLILKKILTNILGFPFCCLVKLAVGNAFPPRTSPGDFAFHQATSFAWPLDVRRLRLVLPKLSHFGSSIVCRSNYKSSSFLFVALVVEVQKRG